MESEVLLETSQINDEFTLLSLFIRADIVVKLVIFILFAASIISWTIIVHKIRLFKSLREISKKFEEEFWSGRSIKEISKQALTIEDSPIKYVFLEAVEEIEKSNQGTRKDVDSLSFRLDKACLTSSLSESKCSSLSGSSETTSGMMSSRLFLSSSANGVSKE